MKKLTFILMAIIATMFSFLAEARKVQWAMPMSHHQPSQHPQEIGNGKMVHGASP